MSRREDLDRLERALDVLPPDYRELIVLVRIEGLSYHDLGQRLGKSSEAVRKTVCRAMSALSKAYGTI